MDDTRCVRVTDLTEVGLRLMLPIETYRMTNTHGYLCTDCGVLVLDVKKHEEWHDAQQPRAEDFDEVGQAHLYPEAMPDDTTHFVIVACRGATADVALSVASRVFARVMP